MKLPWIEISDKVPEDGQCCLTKTKHGIIEGAYVAEDKAFCGYYWQDMNWHASEWIAMDDLED